MRHVEIQGELDKEPIVLVFVRLLRCTMLSSHKPIVGDSHNYQKHLYYL